VLVVGQADALLVLVGGRGRRRGGQLKVVVMVVVLDQIHAQLVEILLPPALLTFLRGLSAVVPLTARVA
jgi:hypothetical protein